MNTPYKVHVSFEGQHSGWLDDMFDLIHRLYNCDSPYSYNKISMAIEINGKDDTGTLEATLHFYGKDNLQRGIIDYE